MTKCMSSINETLRELNREYDRAGREYRAGRLTNAQLLREQSRIIREKDELKRECGQGWNYYDEYSY